MPTFFGEATDIKKLIEKLVTTQVKEHLDYDGNWGDYKLDCEVVTVDIINLDFEVIQVDASTVYYIDVKIGVEGSFDIISNSDGFGQIYVVSVDLVARIAMTRGVRVEKKSL